MDIRKCGKSQTSSKLDLQKKLLSENWEYKRVFKFMDIFKIWYGECLSKNLLSYVICQVSHSGRIRVGRWQSICSLPNLKSWDHLFSLGSGSGRP